MHRPSGTFGTIGWCATARYEFHLDDSGPSVPIERSCKGINRRCECGYGGGDAQYASTNDGRGQCYNERDATANAGCGQCYNERDATTNAVVADGMPQPVQVVSRNRGRNRGPAPVPPLVDPLDASVSFPRRRGAAQPPVFNLIPIADVYPKEQRSYAVAMALGPLTVGESFVSVFGTLASMIRTD